MGGDRTLTLTHARVPGDIEAADRAGLTLVGGTFGVAGEGDAAGASATWGLTDAARLTARDARVTLAHAHAHDQARIDLTDCVTSVNLLDAMTGSVSIAGGTLVAEYVRAERNGLARLSDLAVRAHWITADQYGAVSIDGGTVDADRLVAQGNGTLTLRRARTTAGIGHMDGA